MLKAVHSGDYVIPYFQRGYEWQPSMVSDLFESILQDYCAGLLLFWVLDKKRTEEQIWDPIWGAEIGNSRPSQYLREMMEEGVVSDRAELEGFVQSHFVSSTALDCLLDDDFDGFIRERENHQGAYSWARVLRGEKMP